MSKSGNGPVRPADAPLTPNELTLLTYYHLHGDDPPERYEAALRGLLLKNMLVDKGGGHYEMTERASLYMRRILATPLPTLCWSYQDA